MTAILEEYAIQQLTIPFMPDVDSSEAVLSTWFYGNFSITLNLQPVDNEPTSYQVEAIFYGDDALNLMGLATLPDGTEYTVCTTIKYGYESASNSTFLTVEPQSTQVLMTTKTPEEMQQEAQQGGWLSTWHEWSWWYPWYRLHYILVYNSFLIQRLSTVDKVSGMGLKRKFRGSQPISKFAYQFAEVSVCRKLKLDPLGEERFLFSKLLNFASTFIYEYIKDFKAQNSRLLRRVLETNLQNTTSSNARALK